MLEADATLTVWQVKLGGRVLNARPVSVDQVRAWSEAHHAAEKLPDSRFGARLQQAAINRLFRHAFPWRWTYFVRPMADPLWHLWRLPRQKREELVADFFVHLGILDPSEAPAIER